MHLGELAGEDRTAVNAHVATCARCKERVAFRERGLGAFAGVDSARMISGIETKLAAAAAQAETTAKTRSASKKSDRGRALPIAATAVLAVLAVAVLYPRERPDEITAKGGLGLTIFRERAGKVDRIAAGDRLRAKDRLRFGVDVPDEAKEIMIVSVEDGGKMFAYYPSDGTMRSKPPETTADGALEGAIELDASRADEQIHLVACAKPFALADLKVGGRPDLLDIPHDCKKTSIAVKKEAP